MIDEVVALVLLGAPAWIVGDEVVVDLQVGYEFVFEQQIIAVEELDVDGLDVCLKCWAVFVLDIGE